MSKAVKCFDPKYEVIDRIDQCKDGEICMLRVKKDNTIVAGKDLKSLDYVETEFAIHKSLDHPNVLKTFDSFAYSKLVEYCARPVDRLVLIMEYADGGTLERYIKIHDSGFELSQVPWLVLQITKGLAYIHARDFIHLDLKLDNIFLVNGIPKIGDFGLAAKVNGNGLMKYTGIFGTLQYRAPETLCQLDFGKPYDVWSLGVIITEMVLGGKNFFEIKSTPTMTVEEKQSYCLRKILEKTGVPSESDFPELRNTDAYRYANWNRDLLPEQRYFLEPLRESLGDKGHDFVWYCLSVAPNLRWTCQELLKLPYLRR